MNLKYLYYHIKLLKSKDLSFFTKYLLHTNKPKTLMVFSFLGKRLSISDSLSFLGMYRELFIDEHYNFVSKKENPRILDCGANIGLASIYFKKMYPKAVITAFEPDNAAYELLNKNLSSFGYKDVEVVKKAVWTTDEGITFASHGGTAGRIEAASENSVFMPTVRLKDVLSKETIDFLKIDIEGAEIEVIKDCADVLYKAENIFIEYHSMADMPQELPAILDILTRNGFRYHIKEAFTSALPFIKVDQQTGLDLQLNIFAFKA